MDPMTDEEIAAAVQRGEIQTFGVLIQRYEDKMLRYARKFLFNPDDSQDVVQEIFIKAYSNIKSFDPHRRFSPWLYRIAHNQFINTIKQKSRERISFFDLDVLFPHPVAPETTDAEVKANDIKETLNRYLTQLPSKYREPLILFYLEDQDYKAIAEILHIPTSTVGVRLRRGKLLLKKMMERDGAQ